MKNLTWQNPEQLFVAQVLINKVKSKCCGIKDEHNRPSPNDSKLKNTLYRLVEAFFEANPDILLYICETGDDKQRFRNRLFVRWFNNYSRRDEFVLKTAEVLDESVVNFAAMIVQRSNPRLNGILNDFDETIALLQK